MLTSWRGSCAPAATEHAKSRMRAARFKQLSPSRLSGFELLDFSQDSGGFGFHPLAHAFVISLGELAGLEFEIQVADVLIDDFLPLVEVGEPGLAHARFKVATGHEDVNQRAGEKNTA